MQNTKDQGSTVTLWFAVAVSMLGTWYVGGYFNIVMNIPEAYVLRWIRSVECGRYSPVDNHTFSHELWCSELTEEDEPFLLRDNLKLSTIWAVANSVVDIGIILSVFSCNFLINRFELKRTIYIGAGIFFIGTLASSLVAVFEAYELLIIGRLLCGVAQGMSGLPATVYLPEIAPVRLRGAVGTATIMTMVLGMLTANILGLPMMLGTEARWPVLLFIQCIPVVIMCALLPLCPDSPRRLLVRGDKEAAHRALIWLRRTKDVKEELLDMQTELDAEVNGSSAQQVSFLGLFKSPYLRYVLGISAAPMIAKQFSGFSCVFYYSTSIFKSIGLDHLYSAYATSGLWVVYLFFALISMSLVDRLGRKRLLTFSHSGMIVGLTSFTVFTALSDRYQVDWAKYGCAGSIFFYIGTYATGSASIPWVLPTELFPQSARTPAMMFTSLLCSVTGLITILAFPFMVALLEEYTFLVFVFAVAVITVFIVWRLPETKGKSIDEIQAILSDRFQK